MNEIDIDMDINRNRYNLNEIVNKLLLAEDKFMPEMHLRQCLWTIYKKQTRNTKI